MPDDEERKWGELEGEDWNHHGGEVPVVRVMVSDGSSGGYSETTTGVTEVDKESEETGALTANTRGAGGKRDLRPKTKNHWRNILKRKSNGIMIYCKRIFNSFPATLFRKLEGKGSGN